MDQGNQDAGSAGAYRMAQRNGATVHVDPGPIPVVTPLPQLYAIGQRLSGKCLV